MKPRIAIGDETSVTVDTSKAGPGNLMCRATQMINGRPIDLPTEVEANDDGTTTAYFTPKEKGPVQVELRYGGQLIPSGKYTQEVHSVLIVTLLIFGMVLEEAKFHMIGKSHVKQYGCVWDTTPIYLVSVSCPDGGLCAQAHAAFLAALSPLRCLLIEIRLCPFLQQHFKYSFVNSAPHIYWDIVCVAICMTPILCIGVILDPTSFFYIWNSRVVLRVRYNPFLYIPSYYYFYLLLTPSSLLRITTSPTVNLKYFINYSSLCFRLSRLRSWKLQW